MRIGGAFLRADLLTQPDEGSVAAGESAAWRDAAAEEAALRQARSAGAGPQPADGPAVPASQAAQVSPRSMPPPPSPVSQPTQVFPPTEVSPATQVSPATRISQPSQISQPSPVAPAAPVATASQPVAASQDSQGAQAAQASLTPQASSRAGALSGAANASASPAAPVSMAPSLPAVSARPETGAPQATAAALDRLGTAALQSIGLQPGAYPGAAVHAFGEQVLIDHLHVPGSRALALTELAAAQGTHADLRADAQMGARAAAAAAVLARTFSAEFTVASALADLTHLRAPTRREMAHTLLRNAGLDGARPMGGPPPALPRSQNLLRKPLREAQPPSAAEYYFNADSLTDRDIQSLAPEGAGPISLPSTRAKLPASLKARFEAAYSQFAEDYARIGTRLLGAWIPGAAARHRINTADAHVSVLRPHAQQYLKDTRVMAYEAPRDLGETLQELTAHGYLVALGAGPAVRHLFLQASGGRALALPDGVNPTQWVRENAALVFGVEFAAATAAAPRRKWRMVFDPVGQGPIGDLKHWLAPGLRAEAEERREQARGHTWSETVTDILLDAVPLRATIAALRKRDFLQAALAASMDAMVVLPLLGEAARLAACGVRAGLGVLRAGATRAATVIGVGAVDDSAPLAGRLAAGLQRELAQMSPQGAGQIAPLDLDRVATQIRAVDATLARDLEATADRVRGMAVSGTWRPLRPAGAGADAMADGADAAGASGHQGPPPDELTAAPRAAPFINQDGEVMALLPYGGEPGLYTQTTLSGAPTGMLMMADAGGDVHPLLPLDTLERYRVDAGRLRNATLVRASGTQGTMTAANRHFVAVGADFVEVMPDRALSNGRTVWRVIAPRGARTDPVVHRLIREPATGAWRRPEQSELGLPGGGASQSRRRLMAIAEESEDVGALSTDAFRAHLLTGALQDGGAMATSAQVSRLRDLLERVGQNPRGAAILRAMRAHQQRRGMGPRIVLLRGDHAVAGPGVARARPTLAAREQLFDWHLDLDRLEGASVDEAADELAAVYNNMTGLAETRETFAADLNEPPLSEKLEASWRDWIDAQEALARRMPAHDRQPGPGAQTAPARVIDTLRLQIQELRAHGGITRAALRQVLRASSGEHVESVIDRGAAVRLTGRDGLTSLPPIPGYVRALDVSGQAILDWRNLPRRLTSFVARGCHLSRLPRHLPRSVTHLDVSRNVLRKLDLWPGLRSLRLESAQVGNTLVLPDTVVDVEARYCRLEKLVVRPGSRLRSLHLRGSTIQRIKGALGTQVESINLSHCTGLRPLPDFRRLPKLTHLNLSALRLRLVPPLPPGLRVLNLGNNWSVVPALRLQISRHVMELADCEIDVRFTGISEASLPPRLSGQIGPTFLNLEDELSARARSAPTIQEAIARWYDNPAAPPPADNPGVPQAGAAPAAVAPADPTLAGTAPAADLPTVPRVATADAPEAVPVAAADAAAVHPDPPEDSYAAVAARWQQIAASERNSRAFAEFRLFVGTLADTENAKDPLYGAAFRADVRDWLNECSKADRASLRKTTFAFCLDANQSCQDRTTWMYLQLKSLRLNDDIILGRYEGRLPDVIAAAREAYARSELEKIASRHGDIIDAASKRQAEARGGPGATYTRCKRLDIYLAYTVRLGERAGLRDTGSRTMRFFDSAGVTAAQIDAAWPELRRRLASSGFDTFLARDFEPWRTVLKRQFKQVLETAEAEMRATMQARMDARIKARIATMAIDPAAPDAPALIDDAIIDLGPVVRDAIEDETYRAVTRRFLEERDLARLLGPRIDLPLRK